MRKGSVITALATLFAIYIAATPYITAHQIKSAAEKKDSDALSEHIDFPSVRQSLKDQLNTVIMKEMATEEMQNNPFAALGAAFASTMVDKILELYVTPAGITQMLEGDKPNLNQAPHGQSASTPPSSKTPLSNASMSYQSFNKFAITATNEKGEEGTFILHRHGISWKLAEIIIPLE